MIDLLRFLRRKQDPRKKLKELLKGYALPSFPAAVMNVINLLRDPKSSPNEIAALIQSDPGMHVLVLKTVNSATFGMSRKVDNIRQAVALLGRSRLESLLLPLGVRDAVPKLKAGFLDLRAFWLASARRACLAEEVAAILHPATRLESFAAGLLQDMAVPVLIDAVDARYDRTLEQWHGPESADLPALEESEHGFGHQDIGALMAIEWNLPEYLVHAISGHHGNGVNAIQPAVTVVAGLRYRDLGDQTMDVFAADALRPLLKTDEERVQRIVSAAFERAEEFAAIII